MYPTELNSQMMAEHAAQNMGSVLEAIQVNEEGRTRD
jgi:hypothetical protein